MRRFPRWLMLVLSLAVIAMLTGVTWYYRAQRQRVIDDASRRMEAYAQFAVTQITEWRTTRLGEAAMMAATPHYVSLADRWMKRTPEKAEIDAVLGGFSALQQQYRFHDVQFIDVAGKAYCSLSHHPDALQKESQRTLAEAFRTQRPVFSDLYSDPIKPDPRFDLILPFFVPNSSLPSGAIQFQYRAAHIIYPMVQLWTQNESGELSLIRREGNSVLFLNELRHRPATMPLTLRTPLDDRESLVAKAALGQRGRIQGKDYRGIRVLAVAQAIPGTPWILTAKQDEVEVLSDVRKETATIATVLLLLTITIATALIVIWQRHDRDYYYALFKAENAKQESDLRFKSTLDGMMEGCHIIDFEWRYTYHNAASIRHSGLNKEALLGHTVMEAQPGIEKTGIYPAIQRCMYERTSQHIENEVMRQDGIRKWFEISIQPIPEGVFVLTIDITERREAEERLRESESRNRALFEHMMQGAYRLQQDGTVLDVNPAALRMFGLTKEEFLHRAGENTMWGFVSEDGLPFVDEEQPHVVALKTGTMATAVAGIDNLQNGNRIWMEINAIPEFPEGSDKPSHVLITLHDITDRKRAEIENARLASAIAQLGEVVLIFDANRIVQYANPAFEKVTGYKREDAIGHSLPVNDMQDEEFYRKFWETLESGKSWNGRFVNYRKDGSAYSEDVSVSPIFNRSGAIVNYAYITRDVTEYLKLQNEKDRLQEQFLQSQKMESVGRLAGGVAHDFNNMLSVISGHAQMALDMLDSSDLLYTHLEEISKAALHSADLTRQLLAFARKQTIAPRVLDLNTTVSSSLNMLQRLIGEDIDLAWMPGRNIWPVHIDPAQINQILANLSINARDAIDKHGKIIIETGNAVFDEEYCVNRRGYIPGEYAMLAISDDGRGMNREVLDHLFEPFFTTKKVGQGTGLGLATVYGIVRQNDGFINIYSEPGSGSTFKIYFPRYAGTQAAEAVAATPEPVTGGDETVLLVEDEPSVLKLTRLMLERLGYSVLATSNPAEALEMAGEYEGEIHLLLADVVMPGITGRDLADRLTALRPSIRCVFMSGYTANIIAHRGVLNDGVLFLQKPFSVNELATKLRRVLEYTNG